MKHMKEIKLKAEVGNRGSKHKSKIKTSILNPSLVNCFVCDKVIMKGGISLMMGCVPYSKTGFPKKIGELMGDGFMIIINEDDFLCKRCAAMLNYVDKLEVDLEIIKKALTGYLKTKYNLLNSEEPDLTVSNTENTVLEEVTEAPQFDVSVFLQSTDDNIEPICGSNSLQEEEEVETVAENADFEINNTGYDTWEERTSDSEQLAESLQTSNEIVSSEYFQDHSETSNMEEAEDINNSNGKQTRYQCHICTFQTVKRTFLEKHFQKHLTKLIYQCSLCAKRFKSRTYLLKHMSLHSSFKCDVCSQSFNENKKLLRHILVHKHDGSKPEQEAIDLISEGQHQIQSNAHNSDLMKKEEDPSLKMIETETQNNVEDSNLQKNLHSSPGMGVNYNKIEELMAKLHADRIPCSNNEENTICENNELQNSHTSATIDDWHETAKSSACSDNENNGVALAQMEEDHSTSHYLTNSDILVQDGNGTEQPNTDNIVKIENFSDENTNSLDSYPKEEQDDLPKKWKIFVCSICGLKSHSDYKLKEHLKTHWPSANRMYECHVCSRIFTSQANLTRHIRKHGTSFKKFSCNLCSEELVDKMHLRQHMRKFHGNVLRCLYCSLEFTTKRELKQHELTHPESVTHRCSLCGKCFLTEIRLKIHLKNVHNEVARDEIYKCNICSKTLASFYNLKRHLINHEKSERNVKCNICSEILTDKLHLRQHIEDVHANVYQCPFCQQTFSNKKMCKAHELTHPERYIYKCDSCPSSFTDKVGLEKHNSVYHRDPHCKFCGKEIPEPIKLLHHERRHEMYKNKFPCKHCPKVFQTPSGLKYHMSTHTGKYALYCEICGRGLHSVILLEEHMASHTKEALYTCDVCGRSFSAKSTYRLHRKWHDNPLPYHCKFCNRRFKHTSIMAVHIRRAHTGERPYKCPHCPHTFSVSSSLHKHIILHTKDYPFLCKYCNKGFTARSKIAWHMAKAHGDYDMVNSRPPPCEYKMALKPSETPSVPSEDDPPVEQESFREEISGERFEETVIEEQIIEAGQTIFLFQEGFV